MKKLLSLFVLGAMMTMFWACKDDEETPDGPSITQPAAIEVQISTAADISFTINVPGGYKSSAVSAQGGSASVSTEPVDGATSGTVLVSYTANGTTGAGSVTLTVTDMNNKEKSETISITKTYVVVSGIIASNTTWTADNIYELKGRVIIDNGVTLTIEEGTIIKGREGAGTLASALIVSRGAKIMAEGTSDSPIIFTSILDNIQIGQSMGTNLLKTDNEKWGGVIILGNAPISAKSGDTETTIEGIPADEEYGLYGGDDEDDDSGIFQYVSIRHGGSLIGEGNEINGLTLGGVGSGTTIDHIEIFGTLDDGVEFFGGTVNVSDVLVYWQGDDGIDIDMNYSGTISNFMVVHGDGVGTDEGLEIDGPEGTTYKSGLFTLENGTIISDGLAGTAADIKSDAQGTLSNIVFEGYGTSSLKFEGEYSLGDCTDHASKSYTDALQNLLDDVFVIAECKFDVISVYSKKDDDGNSLCSAVPTADSNAASAKATSFGGATGANKSEFSWTAAGESGFLE